MRIANKDARRAVNNHQEFTGSHLFAENRNGFYTVYSYGYHFPLWAFDGATWYENVDRYSVSTSRHKSHTRPDTMGFFKCDTAQLKRIVAGGTYSNNPVAA